jgi:hypothetical protein
MVLFYSYCIILILPCAMGIPYPGSVAKRVKWHKMLPGAVQVKSGKSLETDTKLEQNSQGSYISCP